MKNRFTYILLILISFQYLSAQRAIPLNYPKQSLKKLHYGFTLGINQMDFTIKRADNFYDLDTVYSIENERKIGFSVGLLADLRLAKHLNLRFNPGLSLGQRNMKYIVKQDTANSQPQFKEVGMLIPSTFIDMPFYLKYSSRRYNNCAVYIIAGTNFRYDLESQKKASNDDEHIIRLKSFDIYYEIGLGMDFYLPYFRFSTELKFSVGTKNILNYDSSEYSNSIKK